MKTMLILTWKNPVGASALSVVLVLFFNLSSSLSSIAQTELFSEDFESLELKDPVDEVLFQEMVWTDVPPSGWTIDNSHKLVGWNLSRRRAFSGEYAFYYGNPAAGTFNTPGSINEGTILTPSVAVPASIGAALSFMVYPDTESRSDGDLLEVWANGKRIWQRLSSSLKIHISDNLGLNSKPILSRQQAVSRIDLCSIHSMIR